MIVRRARKERGLGLWGLVSSYNFLMSALGLSVGERGVYSKASAGTRYMYIHERPSHILGFYHAFLLRDVFLIILRPERKEMKGFFDFRFFFAGDAVFAREFGEPRFFLLLRLLGCGRSCTATFGRLRIQGGQSVRESSDYCEERSP